jgi:hypothetical protein
MHLFYNSFMKRKYCNLNLSTVFLAVVLLVVLPSQGLGADSNQPPEANRMQPDQAPTPFSAAEIRTGCPRNRKIVYQVETFGQPLVFQSLTFVSVYEEKVVFESITTGIDGKRIGSRRMTTGTWKDLQAHASFPRAGTTIRKESYTVPAGTFDCWRYEVTLSKDGKTDIQRYWFAINLPGPPVYFEESVDGEVAYKMTMLKTGL